MSERDEFEVWAEGRFYLNRTEEDEYAYDATHAAWSAWQGARETFQQGVQALTGPVAWMHVMDNTEGIPENEPWVKITQSPENPFGVPGEDYSESFPVTSTPLYAAKQPSQEETK